MKKETELKAKLYDAVERWYDSLDNLAKKLQDDISGEKPFEQNEGDRTGLCFVLDYMDDLKKEIKQLHNNIKTIKPTEKLKLNAMMWRKPETLEPLSYKVSEVIVLSDAEFRDVMKNSLEDRGYLSGRHGDDTCVLLLSENGDDGILVDTQGCNYPRYAAFIPKAKIIANEFMQRVTEEQDSDDGEKNKTKRKRGEEIKDEKSDEKQKVTDMLSAEDIAEQAEYAANAPKCCSEKERALNMLGMLGSNIADEDIYHDESDHDERTEKGYSLEMNMQ
mgnify:FL=1